MTYEIENGIVYANDGKGKCCIGPEQQARIVSDTDSATTYQWQRWDATACAYVDDTTNTTAIQGVVPTNGQAVVQKPLDTVRAAAIAQINAECASRIDAGYTSYAEGSKDGSGNAVALLYKSDASHQADLSMELYLAQQHKAGNLADYKCTWKDASIDGPCHDVSDDIIIQLYTEMGVHILWCKTTADTLVAAVQAAATVDAVAAIAWPDEPAPTAPAA